jgi:TIR domain/CHAT domain
MDFQVNSTNSIKKILILTANPEGTSKLRLDEEVREIKEALRMAKQREQFSIESAEALRYKDIHRFILYYKPYIIHFSGHGTGEEGLVFEDEMGQMRLVKAESLAGLFEMFADHVKCVVLNACYSEHQAKAIAQHIDYVVGMSKQISDKAAIPFARGFYDAIGAGESFEYAYQLGRKVIPIAGFPEELTPKFISNKRCSSNAPESRRETQPMQVFLSYSSKDEKLREQLEMSLSSFEEIRIWHEGKIGGGKNKKYEVEKHFNSAHIVLMLISPNYLKDYPTKIESDIAIARKNAIEARVIPILLNQVTGWERQRLGNLQLSELQALPRNGRFVDARGWKNKNEALSTIAQELIEVVDTIALEKT